jgi:hypothetical protein
MLLRLLKVFTLVTVEPESVLVPIVCLVMVTGLGVKYNVFFTEMVRSTVRVVCRAQQQLSGDRYE